jgi:hypothetical protein
VSATVFIGASSTGSGGALSLVGADASLLGVTFTNCSAQVDGGAVSAVDYQCTRSMRISSLTRVVDSRFERCRAVRGGAVSAVSAAVDVRASVFSGNKALVCGGAVFVSGGAGGLELDVLGAIFDGNSAGGVGGGAVYLQNASAVLAGLNGTGNAAPKGGGGVILWSGVAPALACGLGTVRLSQGREVEAECLLCPSGTYQTGIGMEDFSDCSTCPLGSFSDGAGATACTLCAAGKYSDHLGAQSATACNSCPAGTYETGSGAVDRVACLQCRAGSYGPGNGASACLLCAAGTFSSAIGLIAKESCSTLCPAGTYSAAGWSECTACIAGKYSTVAAIATGAAACSDCKAGTFADAVGASACRSCFAGTFAQAGMSSCLFCSPGSFAAAPGWTACVQCSAGSFSPGGATACVVCHGGSIVSSLPSASVMCNSSGGGVLCALNTRCHDSSCASGTIGRLIPGEAYDNEENITWTIAAPPGAKVVLSFTFLQTEPLYDAIKVYSCFNVSCPVPALMKSYSGTGALPATVEAATGVMRVVWDGHDSCCPKPSAVCTCDDPNNIFLLNGWTANFVIMVPGNCTANTTLRRDAATTLDELAEFIDPAIESPTIASDKRHEGAMQLSLSSQEGFEYKRIIETVFQGAETGGTSKQELAAPRNHLGSYSLLNWARTQQLLPMLPLAMYLHEDSDDTGPGVALHSARAMVASGAQRMAMCGTGNIAAYGDCVASEFARLAILGLPQAGSPAHAGMPLQIRVVKQDAYNQTITPDSLSVLQIYAAVVSSKGEALQNEPTASILGAAIVRMKSGVADFNIALKPLFSQLNAGSARTALLAHVPRIYFQGVDVASGTVMMSPVSQVAISVGSNVCPLGYVLNLDAIVSIQGERSGQCIFCNAGTYSVDSLASGSSNSSDPACVPCPLQALQNGDCSYGGADVRFSLGSWNIVNGIYILTGCPAGYQLVNSVDGTFTNQIQRCQACDKDQYLIDSNNPLFTCQPCQPLAECNGSAFSSRLPGAAWEVSTGRYVLSKCPVGYELVVAEQTCTLCPALFFCPGSNLPKLACPDYSFSPRGSSSALACTSAVFVYFSVTLAIDADSFNSIMQDNFLLAVAASGRILSTRVIIDSFVTTRRAASGAQIRVAVRVAAVDEGQAELIAKYIDERSLNEQLAANGLPKGNLSPVRVGDGVTVMGYLSPGSTAGIAIGVTALVFVLALWLWYMNRRFESAEERMLRLMVRPSALPSLLHTI